MEKKCAIILARVSTSVQDYEPQIDDLVKYAISKGFTEHKIFPTKETGLADFKDKIGLNQLYEFINNNPKYNTVFATELSRFARRQSILHEIKEWFIRRKVQIYLKDTGYTLFDEYGKVTAAGEIMFTLYGYFAESEIKAKKERFARSKRRLMEMGYSISGKTLFGYKRVNTESDKTTLVIHEKDAHIIRTIFGWYLHGIDAQRKNPSIKTIALECVKRGYPKYTHSKRNVNKLLKEAGYTGFKVTNNRRKNPNFESEERDEKYIITNSKIKYPAIISEETFKAVQQRLIENNSKVDKSSQHTTILAKLIKCYACGSHLNANYRTTGNLIRNTYRCSSRAKVKPCTNRQSFSMSMIDSAVWCLIKTDLKLLAEMIKNLNPDENLVELSDYKKQLESKKEELQAEATLIKTSMKNLAPRRNIDITDVLDSWEKKLAKLDKDIGNLEKELANVQMSLSIKNEEMENVYEVVSKNLETIEKSKELLKKYINTFVESIEVIFHDQTYTIIRICFKIFSKPRINFLTNHSIKMDDAEIEKFSYVLLDKSVTQNIKAVKTTKSVRIEKNNVIRVGQFTLPIGLLFEEISRDKLKRTPVLKEFKQFEFTKLNVYK
jgi:DNA invertase Pin-like site-specific DNA recombinase